MLFCGDFALVLDDGTGAYYEITLEVYRRRPDGWESIFSVADAGYPEVGETHPGGWTWGYAWTFGRVSPRSSVRVRFLGEEHELRADDDGFWFIREAPIGEFDHKWVITNMPTKIG
ncbi:MAG TPA: hypothetical protein VE441_12790 [Mycobacterium sp.]|nr:hypothetical protein [Mycobacterium sp.]